MKKIVLSILGTVTFLITGFAQQPKISDPNVQLREAKDFHAINVSSAFDVFITQDSEEKVAVSAAEEKDLQYIKVEVNNGVLKIGWEQKGKWFKGDKKLKAYISFKTLNKLSASGACNVRIIGTLTTDDFDLNLSGATDFSGDLKVAKTLSIDLSGASDVKKLTGSASTLKVEANGASSFKGYDFNVDYCTARATGASDIRITVNRELNAHASGASDINYKGEGQIKDLHTSGASSVSHKSS